MKDVIVGGRRCQVFAVEAPEVLLVEPMDERDLDFLDRETAALKAGARRPFALWSAYRSDAFDGIAAASPSVWYPGWMDFVRTRTPKARRIYLSLGDKESRTRNATMATVEERIRESADILAGTEGLESTLEWNPGNHFVDADRRTARAFLWTIQ